MDPQALLTSAITAAPQTVLVAYLIVLITRLMGHATTDRGDYREDLDAAEARLKAAEERHGAEIARLRESHAADLAAVRAEMADLRDRVSGLTGELDEERRRRWRAEDVAAEARRLAVDAAAQTEPPAEHGPANPT